LRWIFRTARAIPIAPEKEDPELMQRAFEEIDRTLAEGELVAIFPEGRLTVDGRIAPFRRGIERIVERAAGRGQEIPVVPMALRNMWASMWSRCGAGAGSPGRMRLPRRLRARIGVAAGPPAAGAEGTAATLASEVRKLRGNHPEERAMRAKPRDIGPCRVAPDQSP